MINPVESFKSLSTPKKVAVVAGAVAGAAAVGATVGAAVLGKKDLDQFVSIMNEKGTKPSIIDKASVLFGNGFKKLGSNIASFFTSIPEKIASVLPKRGEAGAVETPAPEVPAE